MKLTLRRVVVVLNTHTKFRENQPFHHPIFPKICCVLRTTTTRHKVSFIDFTLLGCTVEHAEATAQQHDVACRT